MGGRCQRDTALPFLGHWTGMNTCTLQRGVLRWFEPIGLILREAEMVRLSCIVLMRSGQSSQSLGSIVTIRIGLFGTQKGVGRTCET